jgi:predicted nucleotidyltransferase
MRLKQLEIDAIKEAVKQYDENAQVFLYGSRIDDTKKGGDIDLLIISDKIKNKEIRKIRLKVFDIIGEQKIDIISSSGINSAFIEHAYKSGIRL